MATREINRLVVLGAAGDLVRRHMLPALAKLIAVGGLPPQFRFVGVGLERLSSRTFRTAAARALAQYASDVSSADRLALTERLHYVQADLDSGPPLGEALGNAPFVAYLALPPAVYPAAVRALRASGIPAGSRVAIEKPFGEDLQSARELTRMLHTAFAERDVYRIDHFLHHQTVQDLLALRFSSSVFEGQLNCDQIERVVITWEETAPVRGRTDFYDRTGALRDMVQSHLLQVLALVAMEPPVSLDEQGLREAKAAVLRRIPALTARDVGSRTSRGRYTAGSIGGELQRAYLEEEGVDPSRRTETYAYLRLFVDTPRWRGVPFVLRTGKALGRSRRRIAIHFRPPRRQLLPARPAVLCLDMGPDRISLDLALVGPPGLPTLTSSPLEVMRPRQDIPASARLLRDVLAGDHTFAVREDEVEQCWRVVDPVVATWRTGIPALQEYPAGSAGPAVPEP